MIRLLAARVPFAAGLFVASLLPARAAGFESAYTTHDWEKCPVSEAPEPDIVTVRGGG
jgi:hypothetical protein